MATKPTPVPSKKNQAAPQTQSLSKKLAKKGVRTSHDFANIMGSLFTDVILGSISPDVCNAACNAGGKLLQTVALQYKYGSRGVSGRKELILADAAA
jgi:hypothetical protein